MRRTYTLDIVHTYGAKNDRRNSGGTLRQKETKREKERENERKREKTREKRERKERQGEKKKEIERNGEKKREQVREKKKRREKERKQCPGSIIINLHSIQFKIN